MTTYSKIQQATIKAACQHYQEHNRVLCADEAGLGKTFVARGIIEQMAEQKLEAQIRADMDGKSLQAWWMTFCDANLNSMSSSEAQSLRNHRWEMLHAFLSETLPEQINTCLYDQNGKNIAGAIKALKNNVNWETIARSCKENEKPNGPELWTALYKRVMKALPLLFLAENGKGRQRNWDFTIPTDPNATVSMQGRVFAKRFLPAEPFRVLYICSNLAIAEQNTRKLAEHSQNSDRGRKNGQADKPDRLSVLWHYLLEYPTPFLEIMPITATLSTEDTAGSSNEKEKLRMLGLSAVTDENHKVLKSARKSGEQFTIKLYHPDLIIFDEFQNFGDIINVASGKYENRDDRLDESLQRISDFCKNLLKSGVGSGETRSVPKLLLLSATPFHALSYDTDGQTWNLNKLDIETIIRFMNDTAADPVGDYQKRTTASEKGDYLYNECGIFRNERIRLLGKDNAAYHLVPCESAGLLPFAAYLQGSGQGNCAGRAIMTTPDLDMVETYSNAKDAAYTVFSEARPCLPSHPRYRRLLQVVTARDADDVPESSGKDLLRSSKHLNQLLWLPPIHPSTPLGGVFAEYKEYSKTLAFSSLKVTPLSVCSQLNRDVDYPPVRIPAHDLQRCVLNLAEGLKEQLREHTADDGQTLLALFGDNAPKLLAEYLLRCGGYAFPVYDKETILQYCRDGCLMDVLREYAQLANDEKLDPKDALTVLMKIVNDSDSDKGPFACNMEAVTSDIRTAFNAPFLPFVLMTTSIGSEGLDFHLYCNRLAHYTRPTSTVELEQKNGRIDRRKSLAQRRWWAKPGSKFRLTQYGKELDAKTGGLCPLWDAGECSLHYYFFYSEYTDEKEKLETLFRRQKEYREAIGSNRIVSEEQLNLSPYLRTQRGRNK